MNRALIILTVSLLTMAQTAAAQGGAREEAEKHFQAGTSLIKVEDFEGAVAEFEISYRLNPHKSALFNLANCYKAIHQYGKSLRAFEQLLEKFNHQLSREMRAGTVKTIKELEALVAKVQVNVDQPGALIKFNDEYEAVSPLNDPFIVGPGTHKLEVHLEGFEPHTMDVNVVSREDKTLVISLSPKNGVDATLPVDPAKVTLETDKASRVLSPLTWTGFGGTALFGVGTGVFWSLWSTQDKEYDQLDAELKDPTIDPSEYDTLKKKTEDAGQEATNMNRVAIACTVATGVFLAATTVSLIFDLKRNKGRSSEKEDNNLVLSPGSLTVKF